jgi:hypothetical protein
MARSNQALVAERAGALGYMAWGVFHVGVAGDIYRNGVVQAGVVRGRLFQLAVYMLCMALVAIIVAVLGNWRNCRVGYWPNLCVVGWARGVWSSSSFVRAMCHRSGDWRRRP